MTSVVHLISRRGSTSTPELELSGEGGSFEFHRETARISGLRDWLDYSGSFGFQTTNGRFTNSQYINRSASTNLGFRLSPDADIRVTSRWTDEEVGVPGPTGRLFADPDQRQDKLNLALGATFNLRLNPRWNQSARFIYAESDSHSLDPVAQDLRRADTPPLPPFSFGDDFQFEFISHQKRSGIHYQSIAAITDSNILSAGFDYEHESAVFTDPFSRVAPTRNNVGLYVQDQAAWQSRVFLTAGFRVERNTAEIPDDLRSVLVSLGSPVSDSDVGFGYSFNPRVSLAVIARQHQEDAAVGSTRIKATFGTGIKEPSLTEAFSPSTFFLGNPDLDPERVRGFDVGIAQEFWKRQVSLELTYFDNRFRDQIAFVSDPVTFGPVTLPGGQLTNFVNEERATARGIEFIGSARPLRQLGLFGSYTFLRSRQEEVSGDVREVGQPLLRRPRHSGSFEVTWTEQRFTATASASFVGRRRDLDPVTFSRFNLDGEPSSMKATQR